MVKSLLHLALFLTIATASAQTVRIKVLDADNMQPVRGVATFTNDGGIDSTRADGTVSLPELKEGSSVLFKHSGYKSKEIPFTRLEKNRTVLLDPLISLSETAAVPTDVFTLGKDSFPGEALNLQRKDFSLYNPLSAADLLASSDEVFVSGNQQGGESPMLRGFTGSSVLLTIDGVRMNNALCHNDNLQNLILLAPDALQSANVFFGPGSTLYGSGAMGGVVDFRFKDPLLSPDSSLKKVFSAFGRFSSANMEKTGYADFNCGTQSFGSFTALSFSGFGDVHMGDGGDYHDFYTRQNYVRERIGVNQAGRIEDSVVDNPDPDVQRSTGYDRFNALEKLRYKAGDNLSFSGTFLYAMTGEAPRYDQLIDNAGSASNPAFIYAECYDGPMHWFFGDLGLEYSGNSKFFNTVKATIAYQNYDESCHNRLFSNRLLTDSTETDNIVSGAVDFSKPVGDRSVVTYGIEADNSVVDATADQQDIITGQATPIQARYPEGYNNYTTGGLYGSIKTRWDSTVTTVAGVRYSRVYLHALQNDTLYLSPVRETKINTGAPSGNIGVIFQPVDFWRLTLNGSTGFRAPDVNDLTRIVSHVDGYVRIPNDNLQPEYAYSVDLGSQLTVGSIIDLRAAFFATYVDNLMVEDNVTYNGQGIIIYGGTTYPVRSLVNKGSADVMGGTINLDLRFNDDFSLKNTITFMAGSDSVFSLPPTFGASHFLFKYDRVRGDFFVRYNGLKTEGTQPTDMMINANEPYLYPTNDDGAHLCPSWFTVNLATTTILTGNLYLDLAVDNILNACYSPYGSGIVAPGRNFICALRGKW